MAKYLFIATLLLTMNTLFIPTVFAETNPKAPQLASQSAIMIDADNGSVLYEKNSTTSMYPASLTKIATAIYAIENGDLDDTVTVSENAVDTVGTTVFLESGEKVTLKKLIQGLLINSGNDAGNAIAEYLSGSVEQFAKDINEYLKHEIGVEQTHFENPHGLFNPDHTTTAKDLAHITSYAVQNEEFRNIFGTVEMKWHGKSWDTTLISHHKMLKGEFPFDNVIGGKTGYVDQSGHTLATLANRGNLNLIVITMNGQTQNKAYQDTANLLNYGFDHFETSSLQGGEVVEIQNQAYKIPEDLKYTHVKDQISITKQLTKQGKLEIYKQNGERINSYHLMKIHHDDGSSQMEAAKNSNSQLNLGFYLSSILTGIVMIGIIGFVFRKIRIRRKSYKSFM
ncbi:D-alanyl-D-alanine carboxypeptidase [Salinibacillus kushneri]|uniref:D-alanyl-D-alanine carboxypeptidase n=1 Tax=Salinibacillus kushneri TaxID=237682 RepID=A0A1I0ASN5_9BACI|nr:D-alanyl-D-alanine carboxypeptidase family protein [Salinibacillus kushneri]SES96780.1 D-alanyl-D-alanine carboxypeptidase [Salinibacillus kushneri]